MLNDDCPAIRVSDGQPFVYGTPWSGSSNIFINSKVPILAVVLLEQAPENTIRQLSNHEAVNKLMPRCFLPYYDSRLMDMAINTLEKIISAVPVYLLKCRPDREAVELVHQCVK
jgi:hypothetical protein